MRRGCWRVLVRNLKREDAMHDRSEGISQLVAVVTLSQDGKCNLVKAARQHVGIQSGQCVYLQVGDELLLNVHSGIEVPASVRWRLTLPADVLERLGASGVTKIALVQRPRALALKRIDVTESPGAHACLIDLETPDAITRRVETHPLPDQLIPQLQARFSTLQFDHDVLAFLSGRQTFEAWKSRRLVGCPDRGDDALRQRLIDRRLQGQAEDGSWDNHVMVTARRLRELAALGLTQEDKSVQRAAAWLLDRPQSPYNPGMFFAADALVEEQVNLIGRKKQGVKGLRFRVLKTSEKKQVMAGDDMIRAPCGPRIMWPNALVLEALLGLGYECHERVQSALRFMTSHDWCECGYQHGSSSWRQSAPLTEEQLDAFEAACIRQYRFGGVYDLAALLADDWPRIAADRLAHVTRYVLRMPDHIQGCEFITTRALSEVRDARISRFARAHLWRFAGIQRPDGTFPDERHGTGFDQFGILEAFARYDHPASKVVIMRALPWIVDAQNGDGSWGTKKTKDVSTWAVLSALISLDDLVPAGLVIAGSVG